MSNSKHTKSPPFYSPFPVFFAVPNDPDEEDIVPGFYTPYFYLHNEAERLNGYDICKGDSHSVRECLREGAFLCSIHFRDGSLKDAICFSKWNGINHMTGLLCLLDDEEGIIDAISYLGFKHPPQMYSNEEQHLKHIGKLDLLVPSIQ